ncbi:ion transporter [Phanerochaete sordida]|uniref:Ion transporter n=1 Tax=Phanerochaete sordida TaxID=48140 RepID=A0A9P3GC90_9APHY|nr:ion transporter [Phanerochaete sordida]
MLELSLALTTSWPVYSGADPGLIARAREERDDDLEERVGNAIEVAIISQAKTFIKSSACQKVIDGIWSGKIVYQADSSRSILSDTYKRNPIHFYDPYKAPLLDHYRLKVPAVRSVLEYSNFLILFILFIIALEFNELDRLNTAEAIFMIYALGFTLEKVAAMQEHGIKVYFKGTWNGFDLAFVTLFCTYAVLRLYGIYHYHPWARTTGMDFLALIAVLMFPRLAFVTLRNNLMVLALRAMIVQFVVLVLIAAFCFGGFLYALWTLSRNGAGYSVGQIAWWMLDLFFGLDASGFDRATEFHGVFGPFMFITYTCLSNTMLTTVLVSILSHTFTTINDDAVAEAMFRRAVSTIEGVKADSLFSYQPPINLIALCMMLPASYILSPRWFHKVNVFMIRLTSFPVLLLIALYERQAKRSGSLTFYETISAAAEKVMDTLPRSLKRLSFFEGFTGADADIDAIFELEEQFDEADESALDLEDSAIPPVDARAHRRQSTMSRHRPSFSVTSARSQGSARAGNGTNGGSPPASPKSSPKSSPKKPELLSPASGSVPLPRSRALSLLSRGLELAASAPSPLAQVFQPLIVSDEPPPEDTNAPPPANAAPGVSSVVSYGPATRRRVPSLHPQPARRAMTVAVPAGDAPAQGARQRFPGVASPTARSGISALAAQPLSESPDDAAQGGPTETAGQIIDEEGGTLTNRLAAIEERQKRIEDLLVQLTENMLRR